MTPMTESQAMWKLAWRLLVRHVNRNLYITVKNNKTRLKATDLWKTSWWQGWNVYLWRCCRRHDKPMPLWRRCRHGIVFQVLSRSATSANTLSTISATYTPPAPIEKKQWLFSDQTRLWVLPLDYQCAIQYKC